MVLQQTNKRLAVCLAVSLLTHLLLWRAAGFFGSYDFRKPVDYGFVAVELPDVVQPAAVALPRSAPDNLPPPDTINTPVEESGEDSQTLNSGSIPTPIAKPSPQPRSAQVSTPGPASDSKPGDTLRPLNSGAFLTTPYEKLTYQLRMLSIPVGTAELEAQNDNGNVVISLRVRSNAAFSNIFLVDNLVESRHVAGRFIMTTIRQQEGAYRSEQMFSINLNRKRVSFSDLISGHHSQQQIPSDQTLDTLSGMYFLRKRPLAVGTTELLHIFDSETYAEVPTEILRTEEITLPNLTRVTTLVLKPLQKTAGIFRRTGDILIWLTNDDAKVPVRIETSIMLGTVTAELISSESEPAASRH